VRQVGAACPAGRRRTSSPRSRGSAILARPTRDRRGDARRSLQTTLNRESPFGSIEGTLDLPRTWPRSRRSLQIDRRSECSVRRAAGFCARRRSRDDMFGGDGGESNSPSRTLNRNPLRACSMLCRQATERPSTGFRSLQSRAPRSGLTPDYATLIRVAAPLNDASTTRGTEVASTLTLAAYAARARVDWRLPGTSFCCLINEA
jgi:hypothetical protein